MIHPSAIVLIWSGAATATAMAGTVPVITESSGVSIGLVVTLLGAAFTMAGIGAWKARGWFNRMNRSEEEHAKLKARVVDLESQIGEIHRT